MSTLANPLRILGLVVCMVSTSNAQGPGPGVQPSPADLAADWQQHHLPLPITPLVTHDVLARELDRIEARARSGFAGRPGDGLVRREIIGASVEGRPIWHLTIGRGPMPVLLWSQMHGDEATATSALLDLIGYIDRVDPGTGDARWLDRLTLHIVPMLNPDGAERFQRRNAQGIDINRDAARLQTPESTALMALRDRLSPAVGFNLHNQNWRTSVGRPPQPAAISLLSVAFDEPRTVNAGRLLTKRLGAVVRNALEPFAAGRLGRYDDEFEPRAFGDLVTRAGTPVLLIETGPWPGAPEDADRALIRLNFVALATALDALASGTVSQADPSRYDSLPENEQRLMHTIVRNARVIVDAGVAPFTGDIGIVSNRRIVEQAGQRTVVTGARVEDLGDLSVFGALNEIDARGRTLAPIFDPGAKAGDRVVIPTGRKTRTPIALGAPAAFWVLEPAEGDGAYRLVEILTIQ
jgi:hypothetical protein